jgi:hypothetical protein
MNLVGTRPFSCEDAQRARATRIAAVGALAALASAGAVALVYVVASLLGAIPQSVLVPGPGGEDPLSLGAAVSAATLAATGATLVFGLLHIVSSRPIIVFRGLALAVLVMSLASPFSIDGAPSEMIATLLAMHVVVAAICVGLLTTLAGRR